MKFGLKKAIFGVIWGGFEGFGPCLGNSHPTHPHLGKVSQKKRLFFLAASLTVWEDLDSGIMILFTIYYFGIKVLITKPRKNCETALTSGIPCIQGIPVF